MDKIHIRDLRLRCIVGTNPEERIRRQAVVLNITLETSLSRAGRSDRLDDTINFKKVAGEVSAMVTGSRFYLIERMADRVAAICLADRRVRGVTVVIDKPASLRRASAAAVEITRRRSGNAGARRG